VRSGNSPSGMRSFTVVWAGQFASMLGTRMTNFALTIWAWQLTHEATALALVGLFFMAPSILMSPLAGALVDRWNRKLAMMLSDIAAGLGTLIIFILLVSSRLEMWHLYPIFAFAGLFQSFQFPAYSAAVSTMVPKQQYARTSGMLSLAQNASGILGPIAAGVALNIVNTEGILLFDMISLIIAIGALLVVKIPQPEVIEAKNVKKNSLIKDSVFGFKYVFARPGLLGLQLTFFVTNFIGNLCYPLLTPMVLARTSNNSLILGSVQSAFGVGGVAGGLALSATGGTKRKVHGIVIGLTVSSLGTAALGLGREPLTWIAAAFIMMVFNPLINGSNQAIWQSKVPPEMQGRIFSTRLLIATMSAPIAMAITGPLADRLLIPGMMPEGWLTPSFSWLVGIGPGAGISLLFIFMGLLGLFVGSAGYMSKQVRNVEDILPDYDSAC